MNTRAARGWRPRRRPSALVALTALLVLTLLSPAAPARAEARAKGHGRIAFVTCCWDLWVVNGDGTGPRRIVRGDLDQWIGDPTWSPDGTELAYVDRSGLRRVRADGSGDVSVVRSVGISAPAWSPKGDRIAFVGGGGWVGFFVGATLPSAIFQVRPDGTGLAPLTGATGYERCPVWSPDGRSVAFVGGSQGGLVEGERVYVAGPVLAGVAPVTVVSPADVSVRGCPAWSPDGSLMAFSGGRDLGEPADMWIVRPDGSGARAFPGDTYYPPAWSPNGRWLAFADTWSFDDMWLVRIDGRARRRLVGPTNHHEVAHPTWAPDGSGIAYGLRTSLWVVDPATGRSRVIYRPKGLAAVEGRIPWTP